MLLLAVILAFTHSLLVPFLVFFVCYSAIIERREVGKIMHARGTGRYFCAPHKGPTNGYYPNPGGSLEIEEDCGTLQCNKLQSSLSSSLC